MNYNDHLPPHFHARYSDDEITVEIETGSTQGNMSPRAKRMILEWREHHLDELRRDWELARQRKPLEQIAPLE